MDPATTVQWYNIVRDRDVRGLNDLLADDVVFFSPVVHKPQIGKTKTAMYLTAAVNVFGNGSFRYIREVVGDRDAVLEFETEVDNIFFNGVDIIKWNDEGKIVEFKVMIRPLKAINIIHEKMAELLSFEWIEGGSANAHQRLQSWRKRHPAGYLLNVLGHSNTFLHKAGYCRHLGDADWQAGDDHGWPQMGNTTKVLALRKEVLVEWARENGVSVKPCGSCAP